MNLEGAQVNYLGMEANAKHDFNATADDELSFRRGQVLKVSAIEDLCRFVHSSGTSFCVSSSHLFHRRSRRRRRYRSTRASPVQLFESNYYNIQVVTCLTSRDRSPELDCDSYVAEFQAITDYGSPFVVVVSQDVFLLLLST